MNITEEYLNRLNEAARIELPKCRVVVSTDTPPRLLVMAWRDGVRLCSPYRDGMADPMELTWDVERDADNCAIAARLLAELWPAESFQTQDEWLDQVKKSSAREAEEEGGT